MELAAVIMVAATLLAATPARADLLAPAELLDGLARPLNLNLQAAPPSMEPPKMDAPSAVPPSAPPPAPSDESGPFYKTPRFWVFAGLALVGAVAVIWGGSQLIHEINGGDPKACGAMSVACAGEGRR